MFPTEPTLAELAEECLLLGLQYLQRRHNPQELLEMGERAIFRFVEQALQHKHEVAAVNAAQVALELYLAEKRGDPPPDRTNENSSRGLFFEQLEQLKCDGPYHGARQVYLLCLVFGYEGKYKNSTTELADAALLREAEELWAQQADESVALRRAVH